MSTRTRQLLLLALSIAALFVGAAWLVWHGFVASHDQLWYDRVDRGYRSMLRKRPPEVRPGQWEFMVGWTLNLHTNFGPPWYWDREKMGSFLDELERRLGGQVGPADIDWIWDEYVGNTTGGQWYSDRFRPTRSPDLEHAVPGCFGLNVE